LFAGDEDMTRFVTRPPAFARVAVALALTSCVAAPAVGRESYGNHVAWAADHLSSLPPEIKASVMRYQAACGEPLAATHFFAVPSKAAAGTVLALHFENLWCANRQVVCRGDACLHEVYTQTSGHYRLVRRSYVPHAAFLDSSR
jgi:hypothetical protein